MAEAHLINEPRRHHDHLHFAVAPNEKGIDMASICSRCDLSAWCFGVTSSYRKDARINLTVPRIRHITTHDSSNCGVVLDLVAKKDEVQPGFFPKRRSSQ